MTTRKESIFDTLDQVKATLEFLAASGVTGFDCSEETLERVEQWTRWNNEAQRSESLEDIQIDLGDCRRCGLSETRTRIVFGEGNPDARLVFVGEGPGYDEDKQGRPFVGAAGKLLTKIIRAMGLEREDVFICNIIKCRPPKNRNPMPDEIETCSPFLERQLAAIQPEVICALGKFAAQTLLNTQTPISRLRGRFHDYQGVPLMPTFHPAYLLRNPEGKRATWEDIQQIMDRLGLKK
ncbi:Uracil-DNA glycosylase, family 4 (EC [Olavius algarvensis associated proteobacterium Delta 3]|nr:Uracil-DNA glycosylase, family 4 (EC [Olavius algarvensis associated proteobacterium Delta 3]CAB5101493.1 Uracil-DNA glycosylase, family 4 (EC [Olavius algarvensis associated proteobacterium Delta 3]